MGKRLLTEGEIQKLLAERKPLAANWQTRLKPRQKADMRYTHRELSLKGDDGDDFRVIVRQSIPNVLDFSIILTFIDSDGAEYRLVRFNGKHPSQHTNKVECGSGKREAPHSF